MNVAFVDARDHFPFSSTLRRISQSVEMRANVGHKNFGPFHAGWHNPGVEAADTANLCWGKSFKFSFVAKFT